MQSDSLAVSAPATVGPFSLIRAERLQELHADALIYRHQPTGCEVLKLRCEDREKAFAIGFATPVADSSGVAHILEHAVLRGSRRFPVRDCFGALRRSSLHTFLNAFTAQDVTIYPVASENEVDFTNLMRVYLDVTLAPLLTRETFEAEGWHLKTNEAGELIYSGVVFNEMLGAHGDPARALYLAGKAALLPDTRYAPDSGGIPSAIPSLSYEGLRDFHTTYYQPSNARVFLYGNGILEHELSVLAEALEGFPSSRHWHEPDLQPPFEAPRQVEVQYPAAAHLKSDNATFITLYWLCAPSTPELRFRFNLLSDIIAGSSATPLKLAIARSGLGAGPHNCYWSDNGSQIIFALGIEGSAPKHTAAFTELVVRELSRLVSDGIPQPLIEMVLSNAEYRIREALTETGIGVSKASPTLHAWLHGHDPIEVHRFEQRFETLRRELTRGKRVFEELIAQYLLQNPHQVTVVAVPSVERAKEEQRAIAAQLHEHASRLSAEQRAQLDERARELEALSSAPDAPQALATIPQLSINDLRREHLATPEERRGEVLCHPLPTHGLSGLQVAFSLQHLPQQFVPYLPLFCRFVFGLGTSSESHEQFTRRIVRDAGRIALAPMVLTTLEDRTPELRLLLSATALDEKLPLLLEILDQGLRDANFENHTRMRELVAQRLAGFERSIESNAMSYAMSRAQAPLLASHSLNDALSGVSQGTILRTALEMLEREPAQLTCIMQQLREAALSTRGALLSVTSEQTQLDTLQRAAEQWFRTLPHAEHQPQAWSTTSWPAQGFVLPSNVHYVAYAADLRRVGYRPTGASLSVVADLNAHYLWDTVRKAGGAYGCVARLERIPGTIVFGSYRDPHLARTLATYRSAGQALQQAPIPEGRVAQGVLAAFRNLDRPDTVWQRASAALVDRLLGITSDDRQRLRDEALATSAQDFHEFGEALEAALAHAQPVVFGGPKVREEGAAAGLELVERI